MNIFDLDYITSVLMDVATMVGTIVGVVGLTAVFVVAGLRIADARAVEAARDAVSAARKAAQIVGNKIENGDPRDSAPTPPTSVSVDVGGSDGPTGFEYVPPNLQIPRDAGTTVALSSPVPDDASELDDDPDADGPFGAVVPVG